MNMTANQTRDLYLTHESGEHGHMDQAIVVWQWLGGWTKVVESYETKDLDYDQKTQTQDAEYDTLRLGFWKPMCLGASPNQAFLVIVRTSQSPAS